MLGSISYSSNHVVGWASSFRLRKVTIWPAAGGEAGWLDDFTGTAEQALSKEDQKISTLPTGITVDKAVTYRPRRGAYQEMWQMAAINASDNLWLYWGTAGSVYDFEGVFTLSDNSQGYGVAVTTATAGDTYYLSPDGASVNNLVPQGLPTTH